MAFPLLTALVGDFFDNWQIDNESLKSFISADVNLFNLAFAAAHLVGYIIQQLMLGGFMLLGKVADAVGIAGKLSKITSKLKSGLKAVGGMVKKGAQKAYLIAKGALRKIADKVIDIAERIGLKWGDDASEGLGRFIGKYGDESTADLARITGKAGPATTEDLFGKFPDKTDEINKLAKNTEHSFDNIRKGAQGEFDYLKNYYDDIDDIKPKFEVGGNRYNPDFTELDNGLKKPIEIKNWEPSTLESPFMRSRLEGQLERYHTLSQSPGFGGEVKLAFRKSMNPSTIAELQAKYDWLEIVNGF